MMLDPSGDPNVSLNPMVAIAATGIRVDLLILIIFSFFTFSTLRRLNFAVPAGLSITILFLSKGLAHGVLADIPRNAVR